MFYDFRFAPFLFLLCAGAVTTFRGLIIIKTKTFEVPLGSYNRVDGTPATWAGAGLVTLGLLSFVALVAMVVFLGA